MATKSNPRKDLNQSAFAIMQQATCEVAPKPIDEKKKAAQESGRRIGVSGGIARVKKLTKEERIDLSRLAASARWKKAP